MCPVRSVTHVSGRAFAHNLLSPILCTRCETRGSVGELLSFRDFGAAGAPIAPFRSRFSDHADSNTQGRYFSLARGSRAAHSKSGPVVTNLGRPPRSPFRRKRWKVANITSASPTNRGLTSHLRRYTVIKQKQRIVCGLPTKTSRNTNLLGVSRLLLCLFA